MIHSIHHVNIRAPAGDVAKLKEFYCDVVGLIDGWRPPFRSRGHWLYAQGHPVIHLVEMSEEERITVPVPATNNVDHVAFRCGDQEAILAKLRSRGVEYAVTQVPVIGDTQVLLRDPLGIGVELTFSARP